VPIAYSVRGSDDTTPFPSVAFLLLGLVKRLYITGGGTLYSIHTTALACVHLPPAK
jgi:hypothetical protein